MTVFHNSCRDYHENTAPPLRLCTIWPSAHDLFSRHTKEKILSLRLRLLSQQYLAKFSQRQIDRAAVSLQHSSCARKPHRFYQRLQVSRLQISRIPSAFAGLSLLHITPLPSGFHAVIRILDMCMVFGLVSFDVVTQHYPSPSADCSHLKWKSQMELLTTPSGSR